MDTQPEILTASVCDAAPCRRTGVPVRQDGGLHARPSALIQRLARRFTARVTIEFAGQRASARSTVALMGLGVQENDRVTLEADGPDAAEAVAALAALLAERAPQAPDAPQAAATPATARPAPHGSLGGVGAAPGLAIGRVVVLGQATLQVDESAEDAEAETRRLDQALEAVRAGLTRQIAEAGQRHARHESEIFGAHLALLEDPALLDDARATIEHGKSAGFAFRAAVQRQCRTLAGLGNPRLAERVSDLQDLERQVLTRLSGSETALPALYPASILVADDLAPSELTRLPRRQIAGIACARGGATSHVAILARAMGIPALVAVGSGLLALPAGQEVLLDASSGWLDPAPAPVTLDDARQAIDAQRQRRARMQDAAGARAETLDGQAIEVAANIGSIDEAREGLANGADAVGLTRTEFLFIDRTEAPTESRQRDSYQAIVDAMDGRGAIIRTLDIGGDKAVPYLTLPAEDNPALGLRGIRTGMANPEVLDTQLRALLSVAPQSALRIMIPMVADLGDLLYVRQRLDALAAERGVGARAELGVMIEVPTAALLADQLAEHADFLSIGTNDLTQYALAMDRCHPGLAARIDALHPGLLRLIAATVDGARRHRRWVGVCGALASDPDAVPVLIGLGVTELSVSPGMVPEIKARVRSLDAAACRERVGELLALPSAAAVRARARALWPAG